VQYPGALYHLINRGDRHEPIFKDDRDRQEFRKTLARLARRQAGMKAP
jgi:hypothetical protein